MLLLAGILSIAVVAFFMLRGVNTQGKTQVGYAQCATRLGLASICYDGYGVWNPDLTTAYNNTEYGIPDSCSTDIGGGLAGTEYDVVGTDTQFHCGSKPPQ
jgi:hypothetical protein